MEDMQMLIEGAKIELSQYPESEFGNSFVYNPSFRHDITQQLADNETKRNRLEIKMIEMEEESGRNAKVLIDKDKEINRL